MKTRPAAAGIAAAALLVGSAGLAAASSTGAAATQDPAAHAASLRTLSTPVGQNTVRLSGADRYATSVDVSADNWTPDDAYEVFLASGEGYADALSAGASTFSAGPLLLTRRDTLPPAVAAEIARLKPCGIVVVGGKGAVSDAVALQADAMVDASSVKCTTP